MKRVALYVRVSTEEQRKHGLSVDNQIDALREFCRENNYTEVGLYNDAGHSAAKSYKTRPALLQLLDDCRLHKIDMVLFTRLDRWFRSLPDYYAVQEVLSSNNVAWRAIWEDYETETSSGVFKVNIMLSIAQAEAQRTSEKISSVFDYKRAKGDYIGPPPFGYVKVNQKLQKDPARSDGVSAFFDAFLDYKPVRDCIGAAKSYGVVIPRNTAYKMLASEKYTGAWKGCSFDPYLSVAQFNAIQLRLKKKLRTPSGQKTYLFHGIAICGYCDHVLSASSRNRHSGKRGDYLQKVYQCHNFLDNFYQNPCPDGCSINEEILEKLLLNKLEGDISLHNEKIQALGLSSKASEAKKSILSLKKKLGRVVELYADGDIDRDTYRAKRDAISSDIAAYESQLAYVDSPIRLDDNWRDLYEMLDDEHKRLFWRRLVKEIRVFKNHEVHIAF